MNGSPTTSADSSWRDEDIVDISNNLKRIMELQKTWSQDASFLARDNLSPLNLSNEKKSHTLGHQNGKELRKNLCLLSVELFTNVLQHLENVRDLNRDHADYENERANRVAKPQRVITTMAQVLFRFLEQRNGNRPMNIWQVNEFVNLSLVSKDFCRAAAGTKFHVTRSRRLSTKKSNESDDEEDSADDSIDESKLTMELSNLTMPRVMLPMQHLHIDMWSPLVDVKSLEMIESAFAKCTTLEVLSVCEVPNLVLQTIISGLSQIPSPSLRQVNLLDQSRHETLPDFPIDFSSFQLRVYNDLNTRPSVRPLFSGTGSGLLKSFVGGVLLVKPDSCFLALETATLFAIEEVDVTDHSEQTTPIVTFPKLKYLKFIERLGWRKDDPSADMQILPQRLCTSPHFPAVTKMKLVNRLPQPLLNDFLENCISLERLQFLASRDSRVYLVVMPRSDEDSAHQKPTECILSQLKGYSSIHGTPVGSLDGIDSRAIESLRATPAAPTQSVDSSDFVIVSAPRLKSLDVSFPLWFNFWITHPSLDNVRLRCRNSFPSLEMPGIPHGFGFSSARKTRSVVLTDIYLPINLMGSQFVDHVSMDVSRTHGIPKVIYPALKSKLTSTLATAGSFWNVSKWNIKPTCSDSERFDLGVFSHPFISNFSCQAREENVHDHIPTYYPKITLETPNAVDINARACVIVLSHVDEMRSLVRLSNTFGPVLTHTSGKLELSSNLKSLESISCDLIPDRSKLHCLNSIDIDGCPQLQSINFAGKPHNYRFSKVKAETDISIKNLPRLQFLSLPNIQGLRHFTIQNCPLLLQFDAFSSLTSQHMLSFTKQLSQSDFPKLECIFVSSGMLEKPAIKGVLDTFATLKNLDASLGDINIVFTFDRKLDYCLRHDRHYRDEVDGVEFKFKSPLPPSAACFGNFLERCEDFPTILSVGVDPVALDNERVIQLGAHELSTEDEESSGKFVAQRIAVWNMSARDLTCNPEPFYY